MDAIFHCEETGKLTRFKCDSLNDLKGKRLFSSVANEERHKRNEQATGMTLAHYTCFVDDGGSDDIDGIADANKGFVWVKNDVSRVPRRYVIVCGYDIYRGIGAGGQVPFFAIDCSISDKAIRLAASVSSETYGCDPFTYAHVLKYARECGKETDYGIEPLSEHELARLFGISQAAVHARRQLVYCCQDVRKAYQDGKIPMSKVYKISRLPTEDQHSFLKKVLTIRLTQQEFNDLVTARLLELGSITGRDGKIRARSGIKIRVRTKNVLLKAENSARKSLAKTGDLRLRGVLQGLQFALSLIPGVNVDPLMSFVIGRHSDEESNE